MKEKKHHTRSHKATGGVNNVDRDLAERPEPRTNAKDIDREAEERKRGGRTKAKEDGEGFSYEGEPTKRRRRGGLTKERERKEVGEIQGEAKRRHAGHKPRKAGGRAASEKSPFSSAYHGEAPKGRKLDLEMD
jgi:hypothetical protein